MVQLVKLSSAAIPSVSPIVSSTSPTKLQPVNHSSAMILPVSIPTSPSQLLTQPACSPFRSQQQNELSPLSLKQQQHQHQQTTRSGAISRARPKNLPDHAIEIMLSWWNQHIDKPFPNESERAALALAGQISTTQVRQWFANRRMRAAVKRSRPNSSASAYVGNFSISNMSPNTVTDSSPTISTAAMAKATMVMTTGTTNSKRSSVASSSSSFIFDIKNNYNNNNGNNSVVKSDFEPTVGPNEIDKYTESIDFVIKSIDEEVS